MNILIVDDESFMLALLSRQLANLGFADSTLCDSAQQAIEILRDESRAVDLILCDLQMPDIDGVEFLRFLGSVGYSGRLVLVSGEDSRIVQSAKRLAQALGLNVIGTLHKPSSTEQLALLIKNQVARTVGAVRARVSPYEADDLRGAISRGELVNYYQPKVDVATGAVVGVETLVRWRHPRDGLVYPDRFIWLAEEHGLIDSLTQAVLTEAMRQSRQWRDQGIFLNVAVNISMDNLDRLDFPDRVMQAAIELGVPLSAMTLEVTESRLMKDRVMAMDILARLRLKHLGLSIDDFGTGHSSLVQLRDLPFNELKVDQSFVKGASQDALLGAIFKANVNMARQLDMKVVAEGVEDRADWDFLRQLGCHIAQGYFIAKPMPATDLDDWLKGWDVRRQELTVS